MGDPVGIPGPDLADGGPPINARCISQKSNPCRLLCMGQAGLLYDAFRRYLEQAVTSG